MELNDNKKINIEMANNSQNFLPVPIPQNPTPSVAKPNYYGKSPYPMPLQVSSRKNDELQYQNILEAPPRNPLLDVPYSSLKKTKLEPYKRDSCYLVDNKRQGVIGLMCNEAGGSNNSNFRRGNTFGLDYEWNLFDNIKTKEYTVEQPVQTLINKQNPTILDSQSLFYPTTNYYLSKNQDYKTYPKPNNITNKGIPFYTYPYKTLNNMENFIDYDQNKNMLNLIIVILTILVLLVIVYVLHITKSKK